MTMLLDYSRKRDWVDCFNSSCFWKPRAEAQEVLMLMMVLKLFSSTLTMRTFLLVSVHSCSLILLDRWYFDLVFYSSLIYDYSSH